MSSPSPEEERELARLRELSEIESLLGLVRMAQADADEFLNEANKRLDELGW